MLLSRKRAACSVAVVRRRGKDGCMTHIALLGTGLLGSGMVENLLTKGHKVRVWNRTPSKLTPLIERGAIAAASPTDAVAGASRVHLVLSADDAVDDVVPNLRSSHGKDVFLIDHSTNLPARVASRSTTLRAQGVRYVSAPVFMSPQNAREASGMLLLAAPADERASLEAMLGPMTGKVLYVGERPDLAAVLKLAGNSMYFALTAAMADVLAMGAGNNVPPEQMLSLFEVWKVGGALPMIGKRLLERSNYPASFELAMARKDAKLMTEAAAQQSLLLLPAICAAMDRSLKAGLADADFATFAKPHHA